jgi:hypothetical protein
MNKKLLTYLSLFVILVFIGYIIYDSSRPGLIAQDQVETSENESLPDLWKISAELPVEVGSLTSVSSSAKGSIYVGGDSFVLCYDSDLKSTWTLKTPYPVTALSASGDTLFAATMDLLLVISSDGKIMDEWGPFEDKGFITSVTSNRSYVAFADAGNKMVFVLDKNGQVKYLVGQSGEKFVVPSPYFDVSLDTDNDLFVANTGMRRIEKRSIDGDIESYFGEPGTAPESFCGCCNPAHMISVPQGFVTAEKGINRIKVLSKTGQFVEFVSSNNNFMVSMPLDLASADGKTIYAANPADSKLYVFTRK